jgi:hypothetical protein
VEDLVRSRPGIGLGRLAAALAPEGIARRTVENVVDHLKRTHRIRQDEQRGFHPLITDPPPPRRAVLRVFPGVPMFAIGAGDRRDDCALYTGCLARFVARHPTGAAHCPPACASFAPSARDRDLERIAGRRAMPQVTL